MDYDLSEDIELNPKCKKAILVLTPGDIRPRSCIGIIGDIKYFEESHKLRFTNYQYITRCNESGQYLPMELPIKQFGLENFFKNNLTIEQNTTYFRLYALTGISELPNRDKYIFIYRKQIEEEAIHTTEKEKAMYFIIFVFFIGLQLF